MILSGHTIGVCSWSLRSVTMRELVAVVKAIGLSDIQLALGGMVGQSPEARKADFDTLRSAGIGITAGMIGFAGEDYSTIARIHDTGGYVPASTYAERREASRRAAEIAAENGISLVSTHVGFIPAPTDAGYGEAMARIRQVADDFAALGIKLGLETGQEPADRLLMFLNSLGARNVVVNFDPANMILYGAGDPIEAVRLLGKHIGQVHLKDATSSNNPGVEWGEEVPFGTGQVDLRRFLGALRDVGYKGPLVFEREAGDDRVADLRSGIAALQRAFA
jgi:sugar phosphate isomerase/epimerase